MNTKLYAENVLIGSQWKSDITLSLDASGYIESIVKGKISGSTIIKEPVIPGMPNCHSHAFQRAFAGYSEYRNFDAHGQPAKDSFWSWRDIMYRLVAKMAPQDLNAIATFLYVEMLKAGYTSVAEFHYLHHQAGGGTYNDPAEMSHQIILAAQGAGIGLTHLPVLYSYAGFGELAPSAAQGRFIHGTEQYLRLIEALHKEYHADANFKLGIAPHSLRAVSDNQLDEIVSNIRSIDSRAPIHIHIAEQIQEVEDCKSFYGSRPVEWLLNNHDLDQHWCLIHATHLSKSEQNNLSMSQAVAGICPTTEANLGDGIFPTQAFLAEGGNFAIGSDSHIAINVADEIRLLEYAQRLITHQRSVLTTIGMPSVGQYLYAKAAKDGAAAISQDVGEIAVGKRADLVVLDLENPSLYNKVGSQYLDAAIFACNQLPVKDVYVAGKKVIDNGRHLLELQANENYKKVLDGLV
ncbi:MAG: formimidoylglutamate deiminase [Kangiellaceae bacterium]|nr:formimidoylglutamate deiminase [Kangiellaceae bacterium]